MAWQPPPTPQEIVQAAQETVETIVGGGQEAAGAAQAAAEETAQEVVVMAQAIIVQAVNATTEAGRHAAHEAVRVHKTVAGGIRRAKDTIQANLPDRAAAAEKAREAEEKRRTWGMVQAVGLVVTQVVITVIGTVASNAAAVGQIIIVIVAVIVLIIVSAMTCGAVASSMTAVAVVQAAVEATLQVVSRAGQGRAMAFLAVQQVRQCLSQGMAAARSEAEALMNSASSREAKEEALAQAYDDLVRKARLLLATRRVALPGR